MEGKSDKLLDVEEPVIANGLVSRGHGLQRAVAEAAGEDDVDDVLRRPAGRGDRVGERDRAFEREVVLDSDLLGEFAFHGLEEGLPGADAAARKQPVLPIVLLLPNEKDSVLAPQDRRHPDSRLHRQVRDEPKPCTPRSLAGSSSSSTSSSSGTGRTTSCATRSSGSATKVSSRSVFRRTILISPR